MKNKKLIAITTVIVLVIIAAAATFALQHKSTDVPVSTVSDNSQTDTTKPTDKSNPPQGKKHSKSSKKSTSDKSKSTSQTSDSSSTTTQQSGSQSTTKDSSTTNKDSGGDGGSNPSKVTFKSKPTFAYYYLWWSHNQWTSHLGPNYPYSASPSPLPATLDADSCSAVTKYSGNVETDVSQGLAYDQDNYQTIYNDVKTAAQAGLSGFFVNWVGTGAAGQTTADSSYSQRLANVFKAVHQVDADGYHFKIILNYKSSASLRTMSQFQNDFDYLKATYGGDSALDHTWSNRIEMVIAGTWKYGDSDITYMGSHFRSNFYLIGDEKPATWDTARADNLDGVTYYWSSQNPYKNPSSFDQLKTFAATIRSTKNPDGSSKPWLAPFTPGYNAQLLYNSPTCVPRKGTQTLHALYDGNLASNPNGWALISWNEISEGTYIVPLTRYGHTYTNELYKIMVNGS